MENREITPENLRVSRHAAVMFVLIVGCGAKQPSPAPATIDAAPAPVVVVTRDAKPPAPSKPTVPERTRSTDVADLRARIDATTDAGELLLLRSDLAVALWSATCSAPTDGLCLARVRRAAKAPANCGPTEDLVVTVRPTKWVQEVEAEVREVRALWGHRDLLAEVADPPSEAEADAYIRNAQLAEAHAAAQLVLGDRAVELLLAEPRPVRLTYAKGDDHLDGASSAKYEAWIDKLRQLDFDEVFRAYAEVSGDPLLARWAPEAVIESIARLGAARALVAEKLHGLELPKQAVGDAERKAAFCDRVRGDVTYWQGLAATDYSQCVEDAEAAGVTGAVVDRCRAALARLRPAP